MKNAIQRREVTQNIVRSFDEDDIKDFAYTALDHMEDALKAPLIERDYPEEGTRDPIFAFQIRKTETCDDGTVFDDWITANVYFTREEAETEGDSRPHHYGVKDEHWRVYCINAEGLLAKLLAQHTRDMP